MTITAKIMNTEVVQDYNETKLRLYGRTKSNELETITVSGYPSYFYGPTDQIKDVEATLIRNDKVVEIDHDVTTTGIKGDELSKVIVTAPWDTRKITDAYEDKIDFFGSDVWLDNQFRIDFGLYTGIKAPSSECNYDELTPVDFPEPEPRLAFIDIETDDRGEFVDDGSRPITSIVGHDSYNQDVVGFFWTGPDRTIEECFPNGRPENLDELRYSTTEKKMLELFEDWVTTRDFDLMSGWNFEDFDAPYIYERFNEIGLDPASLSRENYAKKGFDGVSFSGRTMYDLLTAYDNTKQGELDSKKLDSIAQKELGDNKIPHEDMGYWEMYEKDPEKLLNYNAVDVTLCVRINEKADVIQFWSILRDELGLDFEDTRANNSFIEMMARRDLHEHDLAGPAADYSRESSDYDGGFVFPAYTGVEENVIAIDLASLYPYTMWMCNASPETQVDGADVETLRKAGIDVAETPNGAYFRLDKDGVFKRLVDKAIGLKSEYKTKRNAATPGTEKHAMWDEKYAVAKTVTNSVYGTAGWEKFFLYDEKVAEAITLLGQAVIKETARYINEETIGNVVYGDTDSCYISVPDEWDHEKCISWAEDACSTLNDDVYPEFAETFGIPGEMNKWDIEPEALVTFFQAGKKKRYAYKAFWEDGHYLDDPEYAVKGFDSKRSDTATLTKELQKDVFKIILDGADETKLMKRVKEAQDQISIDNSNLDKIAIPGGIGQELDEYDTEGAQVRGARYMNELCGTEIGKGDKPKRVYLRETLTVGEGEDTEMVDVISFEDVEDISPEILEAIEVRTGDMSEKLIVKPLSPILSAVDVNTEAALKGQTQTGIGAFV